MAGGDQAPVIRRERDRGHVAFMPLERRPFLALAARLLRTLLDACFQELLDVPDFGEIIHRRRCQGPAIRREGDATDPVADVRPAGDDLLAARCIPETEGVVDTTGSYELAVRRERDGDYLARASLQHLLFLRLGDVPEAHAAVHAGGDQNFVVRREVDAPDPELVATESGDLASRGHVPQLRRVIV